VQSAKRPFGSLGGPPPIPPARVLNRFLDLLNQRRDELAAHHHQVSMEKVLSDAQARSCAGNRRGGVCLEFPKPA